MTPDESQALIGFLCAGLVLGIIGSWLDQFLSFIRK